MGWGGGNPIYKHARHFPYLFNSHYKPSSTLKSFYFTDEETGARAHGRLVEEPGFEFNCTSVYCKI